MLILRNRRAVKAFTNPKVSLGAELSVAAGPLGAGAVVDTGIEASPVLSYVKSKGLYGGAQVDGEILRISFGASSFLLSSGIPVLLTLLLPTCSFLA